MKKDIFKFVKPLSPFVMAVVTSSHWDILIGKIKDQYVEHYSKYPSIVEDINHMHNALAINDNPVTMFTNQTKVILCEAVHGAANQAGEAIFNTGDEFMRNSRLSAIRLFSETLLQGIGQSGNMPVHQLSGRGKTRSIEENKLTVNCFLTAVYGVIFTSSYCVPWSPTQKSVDVINEPLTKMLEERFEMDPILSPIGLTDLVSFEQDLHQYMCDEVISKLSEREMTSTDIHNNASTLNTIGYVVDAIARYKKRLTEF